MVSRTNKHDGFIVQRPMAQKVPQTPAASNPTNVPRVYEDA